MSNMLGAQARAAEYNAAKNASARQASREAEDQKLPPKPTAQSLGAFTRNPATNRNKGTKKWTPLILEQTEEEEEDDELEVTAQDNQLQDQPDSSSPIKSSRDSLLIPMDPENPTTGDRPRVKMPIAIPTAPRSMRSAADPFSVPSPTRIINMNMDQMPFMPASAPHYGLPNAFAGQPMDNSLTPEGIPHCGGMMVPTDITPSKQEQKLSTMSELYTQSRTGVNSTLPMFNQPYPFQALQYPYMDNPPLVQLQPWEINQQQAVLNSLYQRPALPHVQSDIIPLSRPTEVPTPAKLLMRHHSSADDYAAHITPSRESLQQSSDDASASKPKENEEPYNRNNKMQRFVAAQQALAKTGKTVLNNPELRRSQEALPTQNTTVEVTNGQQITHDTVTTGTNGKEKATTRTAPRVPPGLSSTPAGFTDFMSASESDGGREDGAADISPEDAQLRAAFGVGTDEWYDLKPVSRLDRQKMTAAVRYVQSKRHESYKRSLTVGRDPKPAQEVQEQFHADRSGWQDVTEEAERIANEHVEKIRAEVGDSPDTRLDDVDQQAYLIRGVGRIAATLKQYAIDGQQGHQDPFNRTKPVPEFATELPSDGSKEYVSLFEDERGGFHNAPTRIARDPRFRPQARDGGKSQADDEWTYRHDMYGRRRL